MTTVRVWDLPTRMFHWLFAIACCVAWLSGDDARYTHLHTFAGYTSLALLLFRLVWGVVGGRYARFAQFVRGPAALLAHLKGFGSTSRSHHLGHNPAGGWAVVILLTLVALLGLSGIAVLGGEEGFGPLAGQISIAQGAAIHQLHEALAWGLLVMVALHLAGVLLESALEGENLPRAMLSGYKRGEAEKAEPRNASGIAVVMVLLLALASAFNLKPYLSSTADTPYQPYRQPMLLQHELWSEGCGECHLAYHPATLPARSWEHLLDSQTEHFGEDLALEEGDIELLRDYAGANSAERVERELSWRTLRSLANNETPLRLTETPYWKRTHADIDEALWNDERVKGRLNCAACHRDAQQGGFSNGAMVLPR